MIPISKEHNSTVVLYCDGNAIAYTDKIIVDTELIDVSTIETPHNFIQRKIGVHGNFKGFPSEGFGKKIKMKIRHNSREGFSNFYISSINNSLVYLVKA